MLKKLLVGFFAILIVIVGLIALLPDRPDSPLSGFIRRIENTTSSEELATLCSSALAAVGESDAKNMIGARGDDLKSAAQAGEENLLAISMHCQMARERLKATH